MSWSETEQYYRTLREIETQLDRRPDGQVPWRDSWRDVFGDRTGLELALRTRWLRLLQVQCDVSMVVELAEAHPGLAAVNGVGVRTSYALAAS